MKRQSLAAQAMFEKYGRKSQREHADGIAALEA
jgi:hypothetical protein